MTKTLKTPATERDFAILKRPIVTEKSAKIAEAGNWVVFEVLKGSRKPEIRTAVERVYKVDVLRVNTLIQKGKTKGAGAIKGKRSDVKKAFVQIKDGQSIEMAQA